MIIRALTSLKDGLPKQKRTLGTVVTIGDDGSF